MPLTITQDGLDSTTGAIVGDLVIGPPIPGPPAPNAPLAAPDLSYGAAAKGPLGGTLYLCDGSMQEGDIVQAGASPSRFVLPVTGLECGPVLGVVINKPRDLVAEVLTGGYASVFTGLSPGARYYLSNAGALIGLPLADYDPVFVHYIGLAVTETTLLVQMKYPLVKRTGHV